MRGVPFCFGCWPGGPITPPPCLRCRGTGDYWTSGVCRRCHRDADPGPDSCTDCYAWGATRLLGWLCHGCFSFRRHNPTPGQCRACGRHQHLGALRTCRLCAKQADLLRRPGGSLDPVAASRHGHQLFLADLFHPRGRRRPSTSSSVDPPDVLPSPLPGHEQLVLFAARRDLAAHGRTGLHLRADPVIAATLERRARVLAGELGWSDRQLNNTYYGIRIVLGLNDSQDAPVKASDVELLRDIDLPVWTVLRVLDDAGVLLEDRTPAIDNWFTEQTHGLPETMAAELATWFHVMKHGSPTPPRRRPRSETTINLHLRWALPSLRAWATAGHVSLREITRDHVLDALPPSGNPRAQTGQGLKSIFRVLKGRKVLFADPTARVKTGSQEARQPLPVDVAALRAALHSPNPATAALAALIAFHGLRAGQLLRLHLTDIRDGRLHLDGRTIVLADPVRVRVGSWLDHRDHRWPQTTNPHLFVHYRTASRTDPVGRRWIRLTLGMPPAAVREDRILDEALATGGDVRRLADLFGLSIQAGTRYTATLSHPDLTNPDRGPNGR